MGPFGNINSMENHSQDFISHKIFMKLISKEYMYISNVSHDCKKSALINYFCKSAVPWKLNSMKNSIILCE